MKLDKPTFLGIGVMRGGTTWLHQMLKTHPDIYVPKIRKELHFFDRHYQKGNDWYRKHFDKKGYKQYGEITPAYISTKEAPERIDKTLKNPKFILILRNPVKRAYSQYKKHLRHNESEETFREYLERTSSVIEKGKYYTHLQNWLKYFDRDQFKIFIFEEMMNDKKKSLKEIADFLDVPSDRFDYSKAKQKTNKSFIPRNKKLFSSIRNAYHSLSKTWFNPILKFLRILKFHRLFLHIMDSKREIPKVKPEDKNWLYKKYEKEIDNLEELLGRDLYIWRMEYSS